MATNLMGICLFTVITLAVRPSTWAHLLTVATGEEWTKERLLEAAERTIDLERVINARFGLDRKDDRLPERFMRETVEDGPGHGTVIDLDAVLDSYYGAMGWALDDGLPTAETLERLRLGWTRAAARGLRPPRRERGRRASAGVPAVLASPARGRPGASGPGAAVVESPGAGGVRAAMRLALRASALMASAPGRRPFFVPGPGRRRNGGTSGHTTAPAGDRGLGGDALQVRPRRPRAERRSAAVSPGVRWR